MGIALAGPTMEAPITQRLSVTDRSSCAGAPPPHPTTADRPLSTHSGPVSSCVYARRDMMVKHLTLLSKNQGLR